MLKSILKSFVRLILEFYLLFDSDNFVNQYAAIITPPTRQLCKTGSTSSSSVPSYTLCLLFKVLFFLDSPFQDTGRSTWPCWSEAASKPASLLTCTFNEVVIQRVLNFNLPTTEIDHEVISNHFHFR